MFGHVLVGASTLSISYQLESIWSLKSRAIIYFSVFVVPFHRENAGTLGWYPSCVSPPRSPLEGDIPNRYPLYKVYMGLIIRGTIPRVPPFSSWSMEPYASLNTKPAPAGTCFPGCFVLHCGWKARPRRTGNKEGQASILQHRKWILSGSVKDIFQFVTIHPGWTKTVWFVGGSDCVPIVDIPGSIGKNRKNRIVFVTMQDIWGKLLKNLLSDIT